jgi:hypothetical protein
MNKNLLWLVSGKQGKRLHKMQLSFLCGYEVEEHSGSLRVKPFTF